MQAAQSKNNRKKRPVLFVDDEEMVLEVGSLMLRKLGYEVISVNNGYKAIEILKENKVAFVILDMLMPGMNGFEIYHKLKKIQPKVKMILTSGYTGDQAKERSASAAPPKDAGVTDNRRVILSGNPARAVGAIWHGTAKLG